MLFPTIEFLLFFVVVFTLTWLLNSRNAAKKGFLLAASYFFYACWNWRFVFVLLFSAVLNYIAGLLLGRFTANDRLRKVVLWVAVAGNLSLLGYFKYWDFASAQLGNLAALVGMPLELGYSGIALPVAISFLTFHGLSYILDVYRGKVAPTRSLRDLMLYMAFFPHLVAGPIVRAADFLAQLSRPSHPREIEIGPAVLLIVGGLFKKVVIASHLATLFVDPIFTNPAGFGSLDLVVGAYAYAIVIFCDFSAYTDIAIGIANLLGYRFPQNFNQPYQAVSLQDFWHRWHMTLSSWLRDYLYIPLGGNRKGRLRTYFNLLVTMTLGGLWHGAGLQFIVWGLMHGLGLAIERFIGELTGFTGKYKTALGAFAGWFITLNFVCIAWIFFRSQTLADALDYFAAIGAGNRTPATLTPLIMVLLALGFLTQFLPRNFGPRLQGAFESWPLPGKVLATSGAVAAIVLLAPTGIAPFIYFQF
jgi:D-alanyl-lipoteichoic acid acyltransferase DltB (MBOAT superfamily)